MAKRFTDTDKFNNPWYRKLPIKYKILWEYLLAECNHAGILKIDIDLISFKIGETITIDDLKFFENRIIFIKDDLIFISKFIEFQYGALNAENRVHNSVLKELKKYNLQGAIKPLTSPINGAKDKDKDKDNSSSLLLSSSCKKKFQKPTIEEIQQYCKERKNNINASAFFDFYEIKDWYVGKNKMKDWRAAVRTWEHNTKNNEKIGNEPNNRYCDAAPILKEYAKHAEECKQNPVSSDYVAQLKAQYLQNQKQQAT